VERPVVDNYVVGGDFVGRSGLGEVGDDVESDPVVGDAEAICGNRAKSRRAPLWLEIAVIEDLRLRVPTAWFLFQKMQRVRGGQGGGDGI
jgi:hypothetical protein